MTLGNHVWTIYQRKYDLNQSYDMVPQSPVPTRPESVEADGGHQVEPEPPHRVSKEAQLLDSVTVGSTGRLSFLGHVQSGFLSSFLAQNKRGSFTSRKYILPCT